MLGVLKLVNNFLKALQCLQFEIRNGLKTCVFVYLMTNSSNLSGLFAHI